MEFFSFKCGDEMGAPQNNFLIVAVNFLWRKEKCE
jgi:hypothetical protein